MTGRAPSARLVFVEDCGVLFEQLGYPRMAGRVVGHLLLSDPPEQSAADLAAGLAASKGSISTTTRLLLRMGLIERTVLPGVRRDYFVACADGWSRMLHDRLTMTASFRELVDRGLGLLGRGQPASRRALTELRDFYTYFEQEFPALVRRWERRRTKGRGSHG